ncbi:MAG: hypothetical protein QXU82_02670 [Candidatus Aenigmatarchaeota archaeon]
MRKAGKNGAAESFFMYFSSIVAVLLIASLAFPSSVLPNAESGNVHLSSGLFIILALSMFLYFMTKERGFKL